MKKIDIGQTIGVLANIGVLVGILLLVFELSQSRQMIQAQTRSSIANGVTDFLVGIGSDPELTTVWSLGATGEPLTQVQQRQFGLLLSAFYRYLEDVHYQYRNGLYDRDEFDTQMEQVGRLLQAPGIRNHWCNRNSVFSREFTSEVDDLVTCP